MSCLPKANPFAGRDRMFVARHPYVTAVLLHVVLFAVIGFYTIAPRSSNSNQEPAASTPVASTPSNNGGFNSENPPFPSSQLQAKISNSMTSADKLTPAEKLNVAGDYA